MTALLTFRDNVKAFVSRYDYIFTPIGKGILALCIYFSISKQFGYFAVLNKGILLVLLALICAFLPVEIITGISAILLILQSFKVTMDVALLSFALIMVFYCGYMRFLPKTGVIALLVPIFYVCHMVYALPIVIGFLVGPAAIVPMAFGVILYYYEGAVADLVKVLAATTDDDDAVQGFQYVLAELLENKELLLTIVIFAVVMLVAYLIHRSSFEHAWMVSFLVAGVLNIVLFLVGSVTLSIEMSIGAILVESVAGVLIAVLCQFWKGVVDYQRTEVLQFEDDDYYYYVKAVPKLSVSESNKNVKHINSKTHN
ncbi:MAG: hypothetical protein J6A03_03445 [Lachnospiraceae bacterium]|nr:hypothetical protein [Lachnospiraceae bacterium]